MKYCQFIEDYLEYTQGNETPEIFHTWVAISTLAGACEKRLYLDRGFFRVDLNMYILLISPAGLCAKSTSMNLGLKMLKETQYTVLEGAILKEKIISDMCEEQKEYIQPDGTPFIHSSVTFVSDELNVLLSTGMDMVKFLVDMWSKDDLYIYKTKNSGSYEINYPFFNFIAAAVPQWFGSTIAGDMGSTGFLARCIIVFADKKRMKVPTPRVTPLQQYARERCVTRLAGIGELYGAITLSDEATEYYEAWYMEQDIAASEDYRMAGYFERRTKVHVLKVAALMAIGDGREQIEKIDFERTFHLFKITELRMRTAYTLSGQNKYTQYILQIIEKLAEAGGVLDAADVIKMIATDVDNYGVKEIFALMEDMSIIKIERNLKTGKKFIHLIGTL